MAKTSCPTFHQTCASSMTSTTPSLGSALPRLYRSSEGTQNSFCIPCLELGIGALKRCAVEVKRTITQPRQPTHPPRTEPDPCKPIPSPAKSPRNNHAPHHPSRHAPCSTT